VPTDAGTGGGGAPATDSLAMPGVVASAGAAAGTAPGTLAWEMVGGVGPGMVSAVGSWPSSALMGCSYSHELTRNVGLDDPTPSPCHAQLDCAAPEIVELNTLLRDPAIYSSDPATICSSSSAQFCFGLSPRETDDVTAITLFWGQTEIAFVVGPPCGPDHPNYGKPGCDAPPIVGALIDRLKAIDALGLADPACAGFVEAPTTDTGARP
jgi:hypothetical protein